MKIIFLDIDGVLNSITDFIESSRYGHPYNTGNKVISSGKLCLLEMILIQTDAKIVISSSWQHYFKLNEIYEMFKERGFKLPRNIIIGKTNERRSISSGPEYFRQYAIEKWLQRRSHITSYVIIDDMEPRHLNNHTKYLITTDMNDGLNYALTQKAIEILGRNEEFQKRYDEDSENLNLLIRSIL